MRRNRERWFYLLISPWLIGLLFFQIVPIVAGLGLGFTDWNLTRTPSWAGLTHVLNAALDPRTHQALANTAKYVIGSVPISLALALALALMLNRTRGLRGNTLMRGVLFLPSVMSGVAIAFAWARLFDPHFGPINTALERIGLHGPGWFKDANWALPTTILLSLWGCGGAMVVYLAGLQAIPRELHEAAMLDGAGRSARLRFITLPLLSPLTFYLVVIALIAAFQLFTPVYVITRGGPQGATLLMGLHVYLTGFQFGRFGEASALALFVLLLTLVVTSIQFHSSRRWVHYES
jgi:multiple sugar transport system permease protein